MSYLLQFAGSRTEGAIQDIVLGGLSAQSPSRLSEHGTLLQQTVPLRDGDAEGAPRWKCKECAKDRIDGK